jgi:hypothetical protein
VDKEFAEGWLTKALADHGKDVWIDVEDIRGGASDWRGRNPARALGDGSRTGVIG